MLIVCMASCYDQKSANILTLPNYLKTRFQIVIGEENVFNYTASFLDIAK